MPPEDLSQRATIDDAVKEVQALAIKQGAFGKDITHPMFGQVLKDGKPTETSAQFWRIVRKAIQKRMDKMAEAASKAAM